MDKEGELYTLDELSSQLQLITESKYVYWTRSVKLKLQEKYGEDLSFNEVRGRYNVVTLSKAAKHIINDICQKN